MAKSKTYVEEVKTFNPVVTECLYGIIDNLQRIYENCLSEVAGVFIVSGFVRVFAQQKNYLDNLREEAADAIKSRDKDAIKRAAYRVNNALDNKAFDDAWSTIAGMYDSLITRTIDGQTSDQLIGSFKTADEILDSCRKYTQEQKEAALDESIKTLQALITL